MSVPATMVREVLVQLNGATDKRAAFEARLRHLQRLKFPQGVNVGSGKRAAYGAREITLLALAIELAQLGVTPERSVELLTNHYQTILDCLMLYQRNRSGALLNLDARALTSGGSVAHAVTYEKLNESLRGRVGMWTRLITLNFGAIVERVLLWFHDRNLPELEAAFATSLRDWANTEGGDNVS